MPAYPIHTMTSKKIILSLGGSLINPKEVDVAYIKKFKNFILEQINNGWSFFIIAGGGAPARQYIDSADAILDGALTDDDKDWLGIHATRFNAHLLRTVFRNEAQPSIIQDPEIDEFDETKKVIVGAGWKPGWSTDYVSNKIAVRYHAPLVINLSNITQVYDSDPNKNPNAKPIDDMTWKDFRAMVGDKWTPGMNTPYDPIAARLADETNTTVLVMDGREFDNLRKCLLGETFVGTMLHN